jgi:hypothetical protein
LAIAAIVALPIRIEDGRMVEHWGVPDRLGALLQLGLTGRPAAEAA